MPPSAVGGVRVGDWCQVPDLSGLGSLTCEQVTIPASQVCESGGRAHVSQASTGFWGWALGSGRCPHLPPASQMPGTSRWLLKSIRVSRRWGRPPPRAVLLPGGTLPSGPQRA